MRFRALKAASQWLGLEACQMWQLSSILRLRALEAAPNLEPFLC